MTVQGEQTSKKVVAEAWGWESTESEMVVIATPTPTEAAYSAKIERNVILWAMVLRSSAAPEVWYGV